jgi:hypothetical protein
MLYTELTAGDKTYKLRLSTRNIVTLENAIKCNPLSIFGSGDEIPPITTMVTILWSSLQQYQHGISLNDAYDIFDEYLKDHTMTDFIPVILDIYKVSGLVAKDKEDDRKNA